MQFKLTSNVRSHRVNQTYECLLVDFSNDPTVHISFDNKGKLTIDWMPRNSDVMQLIDKLVHIHGNSGFADSLISYTASLELPRRSEEP